MKNSKEDFILICLAFLTIVPPQPITDAHVNCPSVCDCYGIEANLTITCTFPNGIYTSFRLPNETRVLDLSNNSLDHVPTELFDGLTQLTSLSLAKNKISVIQQDSFKSLISLQFLNISYNQNASWKGEIKPSDFPSLIAVDMTNNSKSLADKLTSITSLEYISGVNWDRHCSNCNLIRHNISLPEEIPKNCNQPAKYYFMRFFVQCKNVEQCNPYCKPHTEEKEAKKSSDERRRYFFAGYALGNLAIITNVIILVNVLLSSSLRREMSMVLILNMAVCDIMIGVYTNIVSGYNVYDIAASVDFSSTSTPIYSKYGFCRVASVLMTTGEMVSVAASLLLTVEKYTFIVYCMNPDVRLKKIHVIVVMVTVWVASLLFALSPLFKFFQLRYSPSLMCTMPSNHDDANPTFIIYPCAMITFNYLLMVPMYIHIFIVVSQSGADVRIHRNASLAKKVAVLIGTNFVFFAIPMILVSLYGVLYKGHTQTLTDRPLSHFIAYEWLPVMLLAINSFLNPFLYAFQYRKFQREFNARLQDLFGCRLRIKLSRALTTIGNKTMSYATSTSRMDVNQAEPNGDDPVVMRNSVKRLDLAEYNDNGIVLRRINATVHTSGHGNHVDEL